MNLIIITYDGRQVLLCIYADNVNGIVRFHATGDDGKTIMKIENGVESPLIFEKTGKVELFVQGGSEPEPKE